jgi:predicted kinase
MLILFCGLPGSGKSTLCQALARLAPSAVLNKDLIRQAVFGAHTDYSRAQDDLCGEMMLAAAGYLLARQTRLRVFLDGRTYARSYQIAAVVAEAERLAAEWKILHCVCPEPEARRRLETPSHHPAANRNFELYRRIAAEFEPIAYDHLTIDTTKPLATCVTEAARFLKIDS